MSIPIHDNLISFIQEKYLDGTFANVAQNEIEKEPPKDMSFSEV